MAPVNFKTCNFLPVTISKCLVYEILVSTKILIFMQLRFFSFHGLLNGAFSLKYRCIMS